MITLNSSAHLPQEPSFDGCPLVVDLDGTLIHTDMLHEVAIRLFKKNPLLCFAIPLWLMAGKAALKKKICSQVEVDAKSLPFNDILVEWLKIQKLSGRKLVLCTASDLSVATEIANHLDIFDEVIASDGAQNLAGIHKAKLLSERYGQKNYDYIGNSSADLAVWSNARSGVVVSASKALLAKAEKLTEISQVFPKEKNGIKTWVKVFRLHQWIKNVLLFVPLLAAHQAIDAENSSHLFFAFLAFGFCASSVYIANDLFDLDSDRQHPRKRFRPFAAGNVPIWIGTLLAPLMLVIGLGMASFVNESFFNWLIVYFVLTCAYSWGLKRLVLVDCMALAILYTLRIIAGASAINILLSFWLLAFSIFLFLSLAFIKRYAELQLHSSNDVEKAHGRGYYTNDVPLIQQLGITSGFIATLVLALYLNSENVVKLYKHPEIIWGAVPLILLWISWMWLKAHRGEMHDDPIVFAIKDKASIFIGLIFSIVFIVASL